MGAIRTRRLSHAECIFLETFAPLLRDMHRRNRILTEVTATLENFRGARTLEERNKLFDEIQEELALVEHFEVGREEHKPLVH